MAIFHTLAIMIFLNGCASEDVNDLAVMPHAAILEQAALVAPPSHDVEPLPPLRMAGDAPDITVYGFWPYWGDPVNTVPWDQMTHVAIFNVELNADGTLGQTSRWHDNAADAMAYATPYDVKVHLCVTAFSDSILSAVLNSPSLRTAAISELVVLVDTYGAHGVNVDFEGLDYDLKDEMVSFVQELSGQVDEVYVSTPPVDWSGSYDYDELAFASDGLFIMGYNYHWSGGDPGPNAPLHSSGEWGTYGLEWSVTDHLTWGAPAESLVLGLPLYGHDWPTTSNTIPGTATGLGVAQTYASAVADGLSYGQLWNSSSDTAYTFPNSTSQLWYDNHESLATKIQYAVDAGIQGVGFWALTYDDADADLWAAVDAVTHFGGASGFAMTSPSPGAAGTVNAISISGATPGGRVILMAGRNPGSSPVPCGTAFELNNPRMFGWTYADASGELSISRYVRPGVSGRTVLYQAMDTSTCTMTDVLAYTYP